MDMRIFSKLKFTYIVDYIFSDSETEIDWEVFLKI